MSASIKLPPPRKDGGASVEKVLSDRRSVRSYRPKPLGISEISQLLWAAQGLTGTQRYRTAPSAGALFPLEIHMAAGAVTGLESGIYRYDPRGHRIRLTAAGDQRPALCRAALSQGSIRSAPAVLVVCAVSSGSPANTAGAASSMSIWRPAMRWRTLVWRPFRWAWARWSSAHSMTVKWAGSSGLPPVEAPLLLLPVGKPASGAEEKKNKP